MRYKTPSEHLDNVRSGHRATQVTLSCLRRPGIGAWSCPTTDVILCEELARNINRQTDSCPLLPIPSLCSFCRSSSPDLFQLCPLNPVPIPNATTPETTADMSQLEGNKLAFIGGGNMAYAIISGLVSQGLSKESITVSEPWDVNRNKVAALGVPTTTDNLAAARDADIVIIAVKPQVCKTVCEEMKPAWGHRETLPIVLSIAAGITLGSLKGWTRVEGGKTAPTVRAMPNTPALVGEGAVGLYASDDVTDDHKKRLETLLGSIAKAIEWVEKEELLDVVTGISGKSPSDADLASL